jgi:hypothetical protein
MILLIVNRIITNSRYIGIVSQFRATGPTNKMPVKDVLLKFSKVYKIVRGKKESLSDIPSSVENIDRLLGTNIFPKMLRS